MEVELGSVNCHRCYEERVSPRAKGALWERRCGVPPGRTTQVKGLSSPPPKPALFPASQWLHRTGRSWKHGLLQLAMKPEFETKLPSLRLLVGGVCQLQASVARQACLSDSSYTGADTYQLQLRSHRGQSRFSSTTIEWRAVALQPCPQRWRRLPMFLSCTSEE